MPDAPPDTEALLVLAATGDTEARTEARNELVRRYRGRLRDLIAGHLDRRLRARVDPSDVVQESLAEADRKLADYVADPPLPFFLWLRELALEHLIVLYRRHVKAQKRSVTREAGPLGALPEEAVLELLRRLAVEDDGPYGQLERDERRRRIREALPRLSAADREVLVLRHLEGLSVGEIAAALGISEGAVRVRHLRALQRLGRELQPGEGPF